MQKFILFLKMIFVYPVIFFTSLHAIRADNDLKFTLFKLWSRFLVKQASAKVECTHTDLIPLETGYVFVLTHANPLDLCVFIEHLPVNTHFVLDGSETIPYLNGWLKRLKTLRLNPNGESFETIQSDFLAQMDESSVTVFFKSLQHKELSDAFYRLALKEHLTLIPVIIQNSDKLLKKGNHHRVMVDIQVPLYHEEYSDLNENELRQELQRRLKVI